MARLQGEALSRAALAGLAAVSLLAAAPACTRAEPEKITARPWSGTQAGTAKPTGGPSAPQVSPALPANQLRIVRAPEGDVAQVMKLEGARQRQLGRTTLVYVGASWCEPCQRFHRAAADGELDRAFPDLTLVEFDLDADQQRLNAAGYASRFIPLFALPDSEGRATGKFIEGYVKGDGAVGDLTPRLRSLLAK